MAELLYIKGKGSAGIHYGMGIEEFAVNFEHMDGLINLGGPNGMGKTTFMEMCSPFAVIKSKQTDDPKRYSYKNQFLLRDSYIERAYRHQGSVYVFRNDIPAGTTMSPEGYITKDGTPIVNGKITQYRKKVVELFGSEELFYSSIFSCQGGKKLTDRTAGEFKALLIELLGLNRYAKYWESLGKVIKALDIDLGLNAEKQKKYADILAGFDEHKALLEENEEKADRVENRIKVTAEQIAEKEKSISDLKEKILSQEKAEESNRQINDRVSDLLEQVSENDDKITDNLKSFSEWDKKKANDIGASIDIKNKADQIESASKILKTLKGNLDTAEKKKSDLEKDFESKRSELRNLEKKLSDLGIQLNKAENNKDIQDVKQLLYDLRLKLSEKERRVKEISQDLITKKDDASGRLLEQALESYKKSEELLNLRPGTCDIDSCPFITDALVKVKEKSDKKKEIEDHKANVLKDIVELDNKLYAENAYKENTVDSICTVEEQLEKLISDQEQEVSSIKEKINDLPPVYSFESDIRKIEEQIIYSNESISLIKEDIEVNQELASMSGSLELALKTIEAASKEKESRLIELDMITAKLDEKNFNLNEKINDLKKGLKELQISIEQYTTLIRASESDLSELKIRIEGKQEYLIQINQDIAISKSKMEISDDDQAEIVRLKSQESLIKEEITKWTYLRGAVSKSGLQALEIASAAPLLTGLANDLLHSAFGGEFYVDLITEDPETGAEVIDIMVTREDGEQFHLFEYSGGEKTWVLQAFKCAQILVNAEKSGVHFSTCFADEETGALDKDKAERFIKMYRALMEKGDFKKLLFISHIPECQAMADHSLIFQDGGISGSAFDI